MSSSISLTPKQEEVLAHLAAGASIVAAARESGIHRNTIFNWLRSPFFRAMHREAEYAHAVALRDEAQQRARNAYAILDETLNDPDTSRALRLKAALAIIDRAQTPLPYNPPAEDDALSLFAIKSRWKNVAPSPDAGSAPEQAPATNPPAAHKNAQPAPERQPEECSASPAPAATTPIRTPKNAQPLPGRNAPCLCGSGRKYKLCCRNRVESQQRATGSSAPAA